MKKKYFHKACEGLFYSIYSFIKPLADIYHPVWEFLHGLVDESVGHLLVVGIGHAAKGNREFEIT